LPDELHGGDSQLGRYVESKFVVSASPVLHEGSQVLHEGVPGDDYLRRSTSLAFLVLSLLTALSASRLRGGSRPDRNISRLGQVFQPACTPGSLPTLPRHARMSPHWILDGDRHAEPFSCRPGARVGPPTAVS
jgi:hypothetical protein